MKNTSAEAQLATIAANAETPAPSSSSVPSSAFRRPASGTMMRILESEGESAATSDEDFTDEETPLLSSEPSRRAAALATRSPASVPRPSTPLAPDSSQALPVVKNDAPASSSKLSEDDRPEGGTTPDADLFQEDVTCISTNRPFFDERPMFGDDDDESTRQYHDLPTRVMHTDIAGHADESSERVIEAPPSSGLRPSSDGLTLSTPGKVLVIDASASLLNTPPPPATARSPLPSEVATSPRIKVDQTRAAADPLASDRALLRVITAPHSLAPPIVAIRPAPPSARLLVTVGLFTALGMLWVLAVAAMVLSFIAR